LHLVGISTESYYDARIHEYQIYKRKLIFPALRILNYEVKQQGIKSIILSFLKLIVSIKGSHFGYLPRGP